MGTIVTSMAQAGLGMDPELLEEFHRWKEDKGTVNLDLFTQEDRDLIREIAIEKLARMGSMAEVEAFRSRSFIVQEYGPTDAEIVSVVPDSTQEGDPSILIVSTKPDEEDEEDPDPPMRRTRFD